MCKGLDSNSPPCADSWLNLQYLDGHLVASLEVPRMDAPPPGQPHQLSTYCFRPCVPLTSGDFLCFSYEDIDKFEISKNDILSIIF